MATEGGVDDTAALLREMAQLSSRMKDARMGAFTPAEGALKPSERLATRQGVAEAAAQGPGPSPP